MFVISCFMLLSFAGLSSPDQMSVCYACIRLLHDMYLWMVIMYSCLISMKVIILCITVFLHFVLWSIF